MGLRVYPAVEIDGHALADCTDVADTAPVLVRGIEIVWGRSTLTESATPASGTIWLLDPTREWAEKIHRGKLIGRRVSISWTGTPDTGAGVMDPPRVIFRGRVARATATPSDTVDTPDGTRRWLVELYLVDSTSDLGHFRGVDYEAATIEARRSQIESLAIANGTDIAAIHLDTSRTDWSGLPVAPLKGSEHTCLDLLSSLYESVGGETWSYSPDTRTVEHVPRLELPLTTGLATTDQSLGEVVPAVHSAQWQGSTVPGVGLQGGDLAGDPVVRADVENIVNRIEVEWSDQRKDYDDVVNTWEKVQPGEPRISTTMRTWLSRLEDVERAQENRWARILGSERKPPPPKFRTPWTHVFPTRALAEWALQTWETPRPAFISGHLAHEWLTAVDPDWPPIVAPIGGVTRFDAEKGWAAELQTHWLHSTESTYAPASWESLVQKRVTLHTPTAPWWWKLIGAEPVPVEVGEVLTERLLTWGEVNGKGHKFGDSVTWNDLAHVSETNTQIQDLV